MDDAKYALLLSRATAALASDASPATAKQLDSRVERLASALLLEWIVGDQRFESMSQQTEHWLAQFYETIYHDEQPDATRIYTRFGLSLPRASYIARLLRARRTGQWRKAAREELMATLNRKREAALEVEKDGQAHVQEFDLSLSPGAAEELRVVYDRLSAFEAEHERPRPPRTKPGYGNARWLSVPADTLLLILKNL
jgi:hypothetical protein